VVKKGSISLNNLTNGVSLDVCGFLKIIDGTWNNDNGVI
jgi:hypothetical protein